jgi:hypothetical protein
LGVGLTTPPSAVVLLLMMTKKTKCEDSVLHSENLTLGNMNGLMFVDHAS